MQYLHKLLNTENSELAKILRFNLYGLVATLTKANQEYPIDPGYQICEELLEELHQLLQTLPSPNSLILEPVVKQSQVINELKLLKLKDAFNDDNELNFYLGNAHIQSETDE